MNDKPYSPESIEEKERRKELLSLDHIAPLENYRNVIVNAIGTNLSFPHFDPLNGGINTKILFLLETPGRQANGTGFVSRNNPDPTAKRFFIISQEVGIPREITVIWNIVPWYLGDDKKGNKPSSEEIKKGKQLIPGLIKILPKLKSIVLMGITSKNSYDAVNFFQGNIFLCLHSGNKTRISNPNFESDILKTFSNAFKNVA